MEQMIPVMLVRGFLESGKTTWIGKKIQSLSCKEDILVISCEEGDVEFDDVLPKNKSIRFLQLEDEASLNREYLTELTSAYSPSLIIIECNTMWKMIEFELPGNWQVKQRIALLSGETLGIYLDNLRAYIGPMVSRCDQIIINRCHDGPGQLRSIKSKLRPLLDDPAKVVVETDERQYGFSDIEDLIPYPLDQEVLELQPEHYVYWYYDCRDNQSRYEGRKITLSASVKKSPVLPRGDFALGKIAITCCEADMSFLGYVAHYHDLDSVEQFARVKAEAVIRYRFMENYHAVVPYLEVTHMSAVTHCDDAIHY